MSEWTDADFDDLADWLGARVESHNVTDPSDEQTTWIEIQVEDLARALLASGVVVPARLVEEARNARMDYAAVSGYELGYEEGRAEAEQDLSRLRSAVEAVEALLAEWMAWDGSPDGFGTSPRVREALRAALRTEGRDRAGEGAGS